MCGLNQNTELGNTCQIGPTSTLSNGTVIPAVTNTTAIRILYGPLDTLKPSQMAKPHVLVGTWHYVNSSSLRLGSIISGKIVYSDYGNFTLTVPNHSGFGDYTLEWSWGYQRQGITYCAAMNRTKLDRHLYTKYRYYNNC